jgi:hypothetical protein
VLTRFNGITAILRRRERANPGQNDRDGAIL